MTFAERCGLHDAARAAACDTVMRRLQDERIERVRIAWCDLHGVLRGKTLVVGAAMRKALRAGAEGGAAAAASSDASAVRDALASGIGMVSTLMLKDTSDRTAYQVFEAGFAEVLPGFGQANNLLLVPDPASFRVLPWAASTGWMQAQPWFDDGSAVALDSRRALQLALARLHEAGYGLKCGLEVEFHIYRIDRSVADPSLDPHLAAWPGEPPPLTMIHPGYNLLAEGWADMADEPLQIVQRTARGLGLPLRSLEIELGPSQVEAVFEPTDALVAADQMVLFRNGVRQALRRAGYHASFVCRPPFANVMASGWHLHQSLVERATGRNAFCRDTPAAGTSSADARHVLSDVGDHWLAGLLAHGRGMAVFCTPTINGYGRFKPNALAPQAVLWGRDNRGAMLRVLGNCGDAGTRIENRIGEPAANPYLYIAAQVHAGLDGIARKLAAGPATRAPYASVNVDADAKAQENADRDVKAAPGGNANHGATATATATASANTNSNAASTAGTALPTGLGEALDALAADAVLVAAFGGPLIDCLQRVKRSELARYEQAEDGDAWQRREYFSRL